MPDHPTCPYCGGDYAEHVFMEVYRCGACGALSPVIRFPEPDEAEDGLCSSCGETGATIQQVDPSLVYCERCDLDANNPGREIRGLA